MQDARLEQLFERFRRHGDVPALGQVFDETAGELLGVAMGLVREPGEADDLLQETFLTAIERAGRYESGRRLVPWLLGILVHHARERRRLARRGLDATRLERGEPERPEQRLLGSEVEREVERAFGELSARERVVLEAYLKHGKGAAEIALELGGSPGAVRMQIHRGLERLRKALPAGLALGAAGGGLSAQGLGGVRAVVLRAGQTAAETLTLGAGSTAGGLASKLGTAGVLVGKKSLIVALVVAVCALLFTWRALEGRGAAARSSAVAARADQAEASARASEVSLSAERAEVQPVARREGGRTGLSGATELDPLLGGLRGRLVERDGRPVAGCAVALLELEESALLGGLVVAGGVFPRVILATTQSGPEGHFELAGARPRGAFQALGLDLGGARPSVRVVDAALEPGAWTELGDIVLAPTGVLRGRVVDEEGEPLAGVRVRAGFLSDLLLQMGAHELGADGAIGELRSRDSHEDETGLTNEGLQVRFLFEVPAWLSALEERLPFAATRSDSEGRFELTRAPAGRVTLLLDRPGRMAVAARTLMLAENGETELGDVELDAGRTLAGRVLDTAGTPVVGAEVRGGRNANQAVLFAPAQRTDAEGRFRLTGLSHEGQAVVLARRDANSCWSALLGEGEGLELRLGTERELLVEVVDPAQQPVAGVQFDLRPGREATDLGVFAGAARPVTPTFVGEGRWSLGARAPGESVLTVGAPGHVTRSVPLALEATGGAPLVVVLDPSQRATIRVVEGASGRPLARARVTVEFENLRRGRIASGETDAEGAVELELPAGRDETAGPLRLRAEHPHFAPKSVRLQSTAAPVTVELGSGGRVIARADPRALAGKSYMLQLEYLGSGTQRELQLPQFSTFDAEGVSERARLAPGAYRYRVLEALSSHEALNWLDSGGPHTLASDGFELAEGQTLELVIGAPAAPKPGGGSGLVHGRVRLNGATPEGIEVYLTPLSGGTEFEPAQQRLEDGAFRFEGVPAGAYFLNVCRQNHTDGLVSFQQLQTEHFSLTEGEAREFVVELETREVLVQVRDEGGTPAPGTQVTLWRAEDQAGGGFGTTDGRGELRLAVTAAGRFQLTGVHAELGAAQRELTLDGRPEEVLELVLERGVPCAGVARLAPDLAPPSGPVWVTVRAESGLSATAQAYLTFEGSTAPFTFVGLKPGKHLVTALVGNQWMPEVAFELPEWGSSTLELEFGGPAPR